MGCALVVNDKRNMKSAQSQRQVRTNTINVVAMLGEQISKFKDEF